MQKLKKVSRKLSLLRSSGSGSKNFNQSGSGPKILNKSSPGPKILDPTGSTGLRLF
jgi:hypothetical protein